MTLYLLDGRVYRKILRKKKHEGVFLMKMEILAQGYVRESRVDCDEKSIAHS